MMYVAMTCCASRGATVTRSPHQGEPHGHLPGSAVAPREVGDEPPAERAELGVVEVVVQRVTRRRREGPRTRPRAR